MLRWIIILFTLTITSVSGQSVIDSLKKTATNSLSDSTHVLLLIERANAASSSVLDSNTDATLSSETPSESCIMFATEAIRIAEKINFGKGLGNAYKALGFCYYDVSQYPECITNWEEALHAFQKIEDRSGEANMLSNLGVAFNELGDEVKALDFYFKALKIAESTGSKLRTGTALLNIGATYERNPVTRDKALNYFIDASKIFEEIEYNEGLATCNVNIGEIFLFQGKYALALEYFEKARIGFEELQDYKLLSYTMSYEGKAYQKMGDYLSAIKIQFKAYKMSLDRNNKFETVTALIGLAESYSFLKNYSSALEKYFEAQKLAEEIGASYELKSIYAGLVPIYSNLSDYKRALHYQQLLNEIGDKLFSQENSKTIQRFQMEFDLEKKQAQINLLTKDKEIQQAELAKQSVTRNALIIGVIFLILLAFVLFTNYQMKARSNKMLAQQNHEILQQKEEIEAQRDGIESQKEEIENLILNILPMEVAQELRKTGTATPRSHESVTVLFTDFKEFTKIAENMSAQALVEELNECFIAFDQIIEEHGLEKIKTIGDAYMCACGIPTPVEDHPYRTVKAALAIQRYIETTNEKRQAEGSALWELRIGIHTGPLTAGVVGRKKFAYDIWGNTVNIAARLETAGQVGKVNISETTYNLIKERFECQHRGKIMTKNIGEIDMYFVEKEIAPLDVPTEVLA